MKKFIAALFGALILCVPAFALEATVPQFDVYIGTDKLEFKNADYPLLLYKDITYFPMTYDYIHWLDLSSSWVDGEFYIGFHRDSEYKPVGPAAWQSNPAVCHVELAGYKIFVNGKEIDNSREEYPLLNFRGITYFPMTWRFATEEFNLKLSWDGNFHIDKNYDDFGIDIYDVENSKAYFKFETCTETVNEYGDIAYSDFVTHSGYFDAIEKKFDLGGIAKGSGEQYNEGTASVENGILKYMGKAVADLTDFVGTKSTSDEGQEAPKVFANEYKLGSMTLAEITVYADSFPVPHKMYRSFTFLFSGDRITAISGETNTSVEKVMEIGGKYYVSTNKFIYAYAAAQHGLVIITPDGGVKIYKDEDHGNVELMGEIDGKPLVFASWKGKQENVSLVNDGFFTVESDGTLTKIYNYVDFSDSFVMDNQLYLVLDFKGKLLNTATGEEHDYLSWIKSQF